MSNKRKPLPKALRVRVYKKYAGRCAYCGKQIKYEDMQVDHRQPVYLGGDNSFTNLLPACRSCNFYKASYNVDEFRQQIGLITARQNLGTCILKQLPPEDWAHQLAFLAEWDKEPGKKV